MAVRVTCRLEPGVAVGRSADTSSHKPAQAAMASSSSRNFRSAQRRPGPTGIPAISGRALRSCGIVLAGSTGENVRAASARIWPIAAPFGRSHGLTAMLAAADAGDLVIRFAEHRIVDAGIDLDSPRRGSRLLLLLR